MSQVRIPAATKRGKNAQIKKIVFFFAIFLVRIQEFLEIESWAAPTNPIFRDGWPATPTNPQLVATIW